MSEYIVSIHTNQPLQIMLQNVQFRQLLHSHMSLLIHAVYAVLFSSVYMIDCVHETIHNKINYDNRHGRTLLCCLLGDLQRSSRDNRAAVADLDAIRGHLDHSRRHAVRANCHVVRRFVRHELQMRECPRFVKSDMGERMNVSPGH